MTEETHAVPPPQREGLGLAEAHSALEHAGYDSQFSARERGMVHCHACEEAVRADALLVEQVLRVEGVSDPDEQVAVVAAQCPACSSSGVLTLAYGPLAPPMDAEVLSELPDTVSVE